MRLDRVLEELHAELCRYWGSTVIDLTPQRIPSNNSWIKYRKRTSGDILFPLSLWP